MSKRSFGLNAFAMLATGSIRIALAQGTPSLGSVVGIAIDERKAPVVGAEIRTGGRIVLSGPDGRFMVDGIEEGRHQFTARRVGYAPESLSIRFDPRRPDTLEFVLHAIAQKIDGIAVEDEPLVSPRLEGFERRRARKNGGQFVTREDLERRMPQVTSDIIRRLQGVQVVDSMGVQLAISTRGRRLNLAGRGPPVVECVIRIGVDGMLKEPYFAMNTIPVSDIHGVEVYAGAASLPPEFGGARKDAGCGLIMIWTRSR